MTIDNHFISTYAPIVRRIVRQYGTVTNNRDLMQEGNIRQPMASDKIAWNGN